MELLCTSRAIISTLSHSHHHRKYSNPSHGSSTTLLSLKKLTASQKTPGFHYLGTSILRSTTSEETITSKNEPFGARNGTITSDETPEDAHNTYEEVTNVEVPKEESSVHEQMQFFEFFYGLNLKLDSEETNSILIYGSSALIGLWLASAVVGAIDSIPLVSLLVFVWIVAWLWVFLFCSFALGNSLLLVNEFACRLPVKKKKVLEIVGLGYTVWFSSRYLIFKENRDELLTKIEGLKKQVLGTSDE